MQVDLFELESFQQQIYKRVYMAAHESVRDHKDYRKFLFSSKGQLGNLKESLLGGTIFWRKF
jgi:hypothetical protein